jgi:hypothetical protein
MKNKLVYVVSGVVRSGTSMMMHALSHGGMTPAYSPKKGILSKTIDGYVPNEDGYYELFPKERRQKGFPAMYSGMLVKLTLHRWDEVSPVPMKVVMMRRDRDEIFESIKKVRNHIGKPQTDEEVMKMIIDSENRIDEVKAMAVTYDEVWYRDVLLNPLEVFQQLQYHGWPIDPVKCAEIPNPIQYRCRKGGRKGE